MLYSTLATVHNIWRYLEIMRQIRESIMDGTFPQYCQAVRSLPVEEP
jgi:queuine tRNA-ribosyltransferase